jgi:hypothetical protein
VTTVSDVGGFGGFGGQQHRIVAGKVLSGDRDRIVGEVVLIACGDTDRRREIVGEGVLVACKGSIADRWLRIVQRRVFGSANS